MTKKTFCIPLLLAGFIMLFSSIALATDPFPSVDLTGKLSDTHKSYLGINVDTFKVSDIQADFVLVEAFSMYCPICQKDAPNVNAVYEAVSKADTSGKVKFLGIGLGNTPFEVAFYQQKYAVEFPIVWDEDYVVHKALKEVGTPTFYLVKLAGGANEIVYQSSGAIEDVDGFTRMILETAGVK